MKKTRKFYLSVALCIGLVVGASTVLCASYQPIDAIQTNQNSYNPNIQFNSKSNKFCNEAIEEGVYHSGTALAYTGLDNPINFKYENFQALDNGWQTIKKDGYFKNTDIISGMTSLEVTFKKNSNSRLKMWWSKDDRLFETKSIELNESQTTVDFSSYSPNNFKIMAIGDFDAQIESLKINFSCVRRYHRLRMTSPDKQGYFTEANGNEYSYEAGDNLHFLTNVNEGYIFVCWRLADGDKRVLSTETSFEMVMPNHDLNIEVIYAEEKIKVDVVSNDETAGTVTGGGLFTRGDVVKLSVKEKNAKFNGWYLNKELIPFSTELNATYTITNDDFIYHRNDSVVITAKFNYSLTLINDNPSYGSITGSGYYKPNEKVTITATPNKDYRFLGWYSKDKNQLISTQATYTFPMPNYNEEYVARFRSNFLTFGMYPQSQVDDPILLDRLIKRLGSETPDATWQNYSDYYVNIDKIEITTNKTVGMYKDISLENDIYRAVYLTESALRNHTINKLAFFKFEPIEWRILSNDGLVLTESIIDSAQPVYHTQYSHKIGDRTIYSNDYEFSDVRQWLNGHFMDFAFNNIEKDKITTTYVENSFIANYNEENIDYYEYHDVYDKVFLLSQDDTQNPNYGFTESRTRVAYPTDYAYWMNCFTIERHDPGYWMLRTPSRLDTRYVYEIRFADNGDECYDSPCMASSTYSGIRPAITLKKEMIF